MASVLPAEADLSRQVAQVAEFLGLSLSSEQLQKAVTAASCHAVQLGIHSFHSFDLYIGW